MATTTVIIEQPDILVKIFHNSNGEGYQGFGLCVERGHGPSRETVGLPLKESEYIQAAQLEKDNPNALIELLQTKARQETRSRTIQRTSINTLISRMSQLRSEPEQQYSPTRHRAWQAAHFITEALEAEEGLEEAVTLGAKRGRG